MKQWETMHGLLENKADALCSRNATRSEPKHTAGARDRRQNVPVAQLLGAMVKMV